MTDRQIKVLEDVYESLVIMDHMLNDNGQSSIIEQFKRIIAEQKELNLSSLRSQRAAANHKQ